MRCRARGVADDERRRHRGRWRYRRNDSREGPRGEARESANGDRWLRGRTLAVVSQRRIGCRRVGAPTRPLELQCRGPRPQRSGGGRSFGFSGQRDTSRLRTPRLCFTAQEARIRLAFHLIPRAGAAPDQRRPVRRRVATREPAAPSSIARNSRSPLGHERGICRLVETSSSEDLCAIPEGIVEGRSQRGKPFKGSGGARGHNATTADKPTGGLVRARAAVPRPP